MIVFTHKMRFAREFSDRIAFFYNGQTHEIGKPDQIFDAPIKQETADFVRSEL